MGSMRKTYGLVSTCVVSPFGQVTDRETIRVPYPKKPLSIDEDLINPAKNRAIEIARQLEKQGICKVATAKILEERKETEMNIKRRENGEAKRNPATQEIMDLLRKGKSNQEIWAIVQPKYDLDAAKKYYPAWYRNKLQKDGEDLPMPKGALKRAIKSELQKLEAAEKVAARKDTNKKDTNKKDTNKKDTNKKDTNKKDTNKKDTNKKDTNKKAVTAPNKAETEPATAL